MLLTQGATQARRAGPRVARRRPLRRGVEALPRPLSRVLRGQTQRPCRPRVAVHGNGPQERPLQPLLGRPTKPQDPKAVKSEVAAIGGRPK